MTRLESILLPTTLLRAACGLAFVCAMAPLVAAAATAPETCDLAIEHVNVVPMDEERVLHDRTVRGAGDRILSVSSASADGPECDQRVDGRSRFLMPGLNDLHGHIETTAFAEALGVDYGAVNFPDVLAPYPLYGVTGLRILSGAPDILAFRDDGQAATTAPMIVTSGPMLSGNPGVMPEPLTRIIETPDEARVEVRSQAAAGYDLIKVRSNLAPEVFMSVVAEAQSVGLPVDGHMQFRMPVMDILASGQHDIAHLFELTVALQSGGFSQDDLIEALLHCACYVSTTTVVPENIADQLEDHAAVLARPEMAHMHPMVAGNFWQPAMNPNLNNPQMRSAEFFRGVTAQAQAMTVAFQDAGIPILLGSDALNPMLVHGTAVHDELDLLVEGGLTPYQALRAGTATPSEYVPGFEDVGVVQAGRRANLVLVSGNPLRDHGVLRTPDAVVLAGAWLDRGTLQARLDNAVARYPQP